MDKSHKVSKREVSKSQVIKWITCSFKLVSCFLAIKLNGVVKELVLYSNKMDYLGLLVSWKEYWTDLGTGHYLSPGGGGGGDYFGLNKVKFSRSPHLNVTSLKWSHLITFDHFRDPPPRHMSLFFKQIWLVSPLNPSKVFSDPPFWVLSYDWSHLLLS